MFEKSDSSNRRKKMVASFSISARFAVNFELVFVFTQEHDFSWSFHFKAAERAQVLLKTVQRDF